MRNEDKTMYAGYWLRRFLDEYVTTVRNLSSNTRKSYRDTFRLLLPCISRLCKKSPDVLLVTDIDDNRVLSFLKHLEDDRKVSISTRNQRLAAIFAFAKYVSMNSPEHIEWCRSIRCIPIKKASKRLITYLEKSEMDALLSLPNIKTEQGWRDYVLLLFLYNTGARAEEAATLKIRDLQIQKNCKAIPLVTIVGKGSKTRRCPLWDITAKALRDLIKGRDSDQHVFINRLGDPITRFGIYEMVTRYADILEKSMPSVCSKRISPHTIRHTAATHLLQAGNDINTIRAWLGHVSVNTTNIYAEVDMQTKAKALAKCETSDLKSPKKHWKEDKNLMSFLDSL